MRPLVAEFVGTLGLVYTATISSALLTTRGPELAALGLAEGLVLAALATALSPSSGAYFNPAVTFGMALTRRIDLKTTVAYIVTQLLAALAAAALARASLPSDRPDAAAEGTPELMQGLSLGQGILVEALLTFFFVLVIFGTAADKRTPKMGALFVGLVLAAAVFAGGPITGAAVNPARWFGPAVLSGHTANALVWIVGPMVGAALAALLYTSVLEEPESRAHEEDKVKKAQV